ncbi:hypothetical protein E2C01_067809 [Portunus trituberculatus]|uniref:Uncharacterized protein n=1 Tax=Portunus trituberculatus TaxID=210409 RepID=A0A5B7HXS4_PORTR|nr:hypothetical protein [Portunus trituberculatus]
MKKKVREMSRHFGLQTREKSGLGIFLVPSPEEDSKAGFIAVFVHKNLMGGSWTDERPLHFRSYPGLPYFNTSLSSSGKLMKSI